MNKVKGMFAGKLFLGIVIAIIYIPMISVILFSFNSSKSLTVWTGFSLKWYTGFFNNRNLVSAVANTFGIAIISTLVSTIIGTLAAIALTKHKKVLRETILGISNIPIISPEIVTAIAFFVFFGSFPLLFQSGYFKIVLAHITFSTPYVILAVYPKLKTLDNDLVNAAADLGATPTQTLFKVILPQIKVAILAGAMIAFAMSFDDFVISYFAAGGKVSNISVYLYTSLKKGIEPSVNALSTVIMLVIGIKIISDYVKAGKKKVED